MGYTVMLDFDKEGQDKINNIINAVSDNGVNPFMVGGTPHLAIASYRDINEDEFYRRFQEFASKAEGFELRFDSAGIFYFDKNIIYLAPVMNEKLSSVHGEFHKLFNSDCCNDPFVHYSKDNWVPNCRVAVNASMEETLSAVKTLSEVFTPLTVKVESIRVVNYSTRETTSIYTLK